MVNEGIGNQIAEGLFAAVTAAPAAPAPETSSAVAPAAAPAPADTATAASAPVPAAEHAAPAAAPVAAAPAAPVDGKTVPLPAFLDMRDENKTLKARLAELEAKTAANPPAPMPSFKDDPEAFASYMAEHTNRVAVGTKFDVSEMTAREKHGDDKVTSAMDWGMQRSQQSPAFAADYLKQKNPVDWIVKQHKQSNLMTEIGDDPDEYVRKNAERLGYMPKTAAAAPAPATPAPAAAPASPQPAPQAAPPRSIATAPSAGGPAQVPTGPLAAFDAVFPGP